MSDDDLLPDHKFSLKVDFDTRLDGKARATAFCYAVGDDRQIARARLLDFMLKSIMRELEWAELMGRIKQGLEDMSARKCATYEIPVNEFTIVIHR